MERVEVPASIATGFVEWNSVFAMRIDEAELKRRLSSSKNLANSVKSEPASVPAPMPANPGAARPIVIHEDIDHGVRRGRPDVPEPIRDIMAHLTQTSSNSSIAEVFGVSNDVVERAASGRVGGRPANAERAEKLKARKADIQDLALLKLMASLNLISPEKLEDCSAKDLSHIAGNLSKVSQGMDPSTGGFGNNTNIIVYAPEIKKEDKYKTVDV